MLDAGRPLASYGIQKGALLKLLPVEPPTYDGADGGAAAGDTLPDGSPRLASPLHELHRHWRRALAGLLEGHAPRLAPAGTGGWPRASASCLFCVTIAREAMRSTMPKQLTLWHELHKC